MSRKQAFSRHIIYNGSVSLRITPVCLRAHAVRQAKTQRRKDPAKVAGRQQITNIENVPKSRKRRFATKSPKHQLTQNIVYQYINIGEF
jgi:hypothetical protein